MSQRDSRDRTVLQPTPAAAIDVSELRFDFILFHLFKFVFEYLYIVYLYIVYLYILSLYSD